MAKALDEKFLVDADSASEQEIAEALELLARKRQRQDKIAKGLIKGASTVKWADMSDEQKEKSKAYNRRRMIKMSLYAKKAQEAGITVTEDEVDAYLAG